MKQSQQDSNLSDEMSALSNQVDNSVELSCCGWPLDDDGFCHGCWEHCL